MIAALLFAALWVSPAAAPAAGTAQQTQAGLEARVKSNTQDAEAHYGLCRVYYNLEKWDAAIEQCQQAVHFGSDSQYHNWLGRAYGSKAEHAPWYQAVSLAKKARVEFEKAVAADGDNQQARLDLAEYYIEAPAFLGGGKDKAEAQAVALAKVNHAAALKVRAEIAASNKDNGTAESLLKQAVDASDRPAEALSDLAEFYRHTGDLAAMQATVEQIAKRVGARNNARDDDALYEGAAMLVRTNRALPQATAMLRRFISDGGTDNTPVYAAMYQLGLALKKQGDATAAQAQFQNAVELADYRPAKQALSKTDE